jgi:GNAT superfamily N-acetyltransferase
MSETPRVRPAASRDRLELLELWVELVEHHRRLDPDYPDLPDLRESLGRELDDGLHDPACRLWVAELGRELVAFLFAEVGEDAAEADGLQKCGTIQELYVVPELRDHGLARALVDEADAWFRERRVGRASVRVELANQDAADFWHHLGFDDSDRCDPVGRHFERRL